MLKLCTSCGQPMPDARCGRCGSDEARDVYGRLIPSRRARRAALLTQFAGIALAVACVAAGVTAFTEYGPGVQASVTKALQGKDDLPPPAPPPAGQAPVVPAPVVPAPVVPAPFVPAPPVRAAAPAVDQAPVTQRPAARAPVAVPPPAPAPAAVRPVAPEPVVVVPPVARPRAAQPPAVVPPAPARPAPRVITHHVTGTLKSNEEFDVTYGAPPCASGSYGVGQAVRVSFSRGVVTGALTGCRWVTTGEQINMGMGSAGYRRAAPVFDLDVPALPEAASYTVTVGPDQCTVPGSSLAAAGWTLDLS
jgi:hypothetical protein